MKLIDRLSADYTSGKFNGGISVLVIYSCKGNTYNYYTSDGKFYEQVEQATKAHRTFNDFMRANNIKVTEIGKKNPIWVVIFFIRNNFDAFFFEIIHQIEDGIIIKFELTECIIDIALIKNARVLCFL